MGLSSTDENAHLAEITRLLPRRLARVAERTLALVIVRGSIPRNTLRGICEAPLTEQVPKKFSAQARPNGGICVEFVPYEENSAGAIVLSRRAEILQRIEKTVREEGPLRCTIIYAHAEGYHAKKAAEEIAAIADEAILQLWRNRATCAVLGPRWIRNIWSNLAAPFRHASQGSKILRAGIPRMRGAAFVVGAGPSLDESILSLIKTQRKKITLICCDTALPALSRANIAPDICVALESQYYNLRDFLPFCGGARAASQPMPAPVLFCDISAHPSSARPFDKAFFFCTAFADISFFRRMRRLFGTTVPPLGSVGLSAAHGALFGGANTVLFSGLDFAFYRGMSHCIHAPSYARQMERQTRAQPSDAAHFMLEHALVPVGGVERITNDAEETPTQKGTARKVTDATLASYARRMDELLSHGVLRAEAPMELYEVGNTASMLRAPKAITAVACAAMLENLEDAALWWDETELLPEDIRGALQGEYDIAHGLDEELARCEQNGEAPPERLWDAGLDFLCVTLFEDIFLIRKSLRPDTMAGDAAGNAIFWKEKNLYQRVRQNAKRVMVGVQNALGEI